MLKDHCCNMPVKLLILIYYDQYYIYTASGLILRTRTEGHGECKLEMNAENTRKL